MTEPRALIGARRFDAEDRNGRPVFDVKVEAKVNVAWLREGHNIERARHDLAQAAKMFMERLEAEREGEL